MRRSEAILLVVKFSRDSTIRGITRLQKILFLLEMEGGLVLEDGPFGFAPDQLGPLSSQAYDDLVLLEELGLVVRVRADGTMLKRKKKGLRELGISDLLDDEDGGQSVPDPPEHPEFPEEAGVEVLARGSSGYEEVVYRLTKKGAEAIERLGVEDLDATLVKRLTKKYGRYSLSELLKHVYVTYKDFTVESKIRGRVLGEE